MSELVQQTKNDIKKGSKSFALASFFFSQKEKEAAWKLYSWCRYCDDEIDNAKSLEEAQEKVQVLIQKTLACYEEDYPLEHPWPALKQVVSDYGIPKKYPLDLLRGFQMDAEGHLIRDREILFDYCYCVAGTVGLMMCHVMGVSSQIALNHAVDLGRAMQLTNIARDIREDYLNKRIYLPEAWLTEAQLTRENFFEKPNRAGLRKVVEKLLSEANSLYKNGIEGLKHLPLRSAWAVCIALFVYRDIGAQVLKKDSWDHRVVVSPLRKIYLLGLASCCLIPLIFSRCVQPWKASAQLDLWSEK